MTSVEFRPVATFTAAQFSTQVSQRRAQHDGLVTAAVTLFVPQRNVLFVGLSDGQILYWETDGKADRRAKDGPPRVLNEHKGGVRCLHFVESLCSGVMFSGAADRNIKMWDLSDPRSGITCVHTLFGHGGTILAIEYGSEMLFSSSTDGLLCVWRDQSPARLLRFPALGIRQKITAGAKSGPQESKRGPKETWFLSISIREGDAPIVFAGDSEGHVHIFKSSDGSLTEGDQDHVFGLSAKVKIHDLGISKILCAPNESFLFTLSYDQKFKTLDSMTGQVVFEESNQCGVVFNSLAWDAARQDAIVADDKGNVGLYNLYMESCVTWRNLTSDPIIQIHYEPVTHRLLMLSPHILRVMDIVRGIKLTEFNEHTGPVVAMAARPTPQGGLLFTAAMDNTIRMWDTGVLECIKCLKEKKHEITAMVYLPRANVIITGHENSDLKMWSFDAQQDAHLKTVSGQQAHENTISSLTWAAGAVPEGLATGPGVASSEVADVGAETLIAGSYDRQLSLWKVTISNDGTAMAKFERAFLAHEDVGDEILAVAYCPAANAIFTGGNGGVIRRWAFSTVKQLEAEYNGHEDAVECFAVDGNFLFSGSADYTVRIWETVHGHVLKTVKIHEVTVQALLVLPDSGVVASCGYDGKVIFWDPLMGQATGVDELQTHEQPEEFRSLAYISTSRAILVGCESGRIIAFPTPVGGASSSIGNTIPKVIGEIETPRTEDGDGEIGLEALEMIRRKGAP